jgi:hypothetical protein
MGESPRDLAQAVSATNPVRWYHFSWLQYPQYITYVHIKKMFVTRMLWVDSLRRRIQIFCFQIFFIITNTTLNI